MRGLIALLFVAVVASAETFDSNGARIHYLDEGEGTPVVLIHGYTGSAERHFVSSGVFADLKKDHRVIAFDVRGHGRSDKPKDPKAYGAEMSEDVVRLLDHLGIPRAHVVGFSMGAMIAGHLLTKHPDRVLTATFAAYHPVRWSEKEERDAEEAARDLESATPFRAFVLAVPSPTPRSEEQVLELARGLAARNDPKALAAYQRGRRDLAVTDEQLRAIRVPLLGVVGGNDVTAAGLRELQRVMPAMKLVVVEGAEHGGERGVLRRPEFLAAVRELFATTRPRARDIGIAPGILPPGPLNAITDVAGVRVGQTTLMRGGNVRTGVTVILPHERNLFREKVAGAVFVGNGFGKLMGSTQIEELGEIESPIALTSTLNVPRVADALIDWMLALPGNEDVRSINVVVGETNDGQLNDIRGRHVGREEVFAALRGAKGGAVEEGSVGAGTGTVAFGWKGGIGTSSRRLPAKMGGWTVGVLVQSNYGGILTIDGAPVGRALGQYYLRNELENADGSIMIVIATDAPVDARNLRRMGARAMMGLARTGAAATNGSGDYALAFSTNRNGSVKNDDMSPLFLATIEATEEAIYNSMLRATDVGKVRAIPVEEVRRVVGGRK